jgi:hypothetical protein
LVEEALQERKFSAAIVSYQHRSCPILEGHLLRLPAELTQTPVLFYTDWRCKVNEPKSLVPALQKRQPFAHELKCLSRIQEVLLMAARAAEASKFPKRI